MDLEPAATGSWGTVVWAVDAAGKAPAYEYFRDLDYKDAAKMQALFNRLAADGFIKNDEKFKKLYDRNLREFKSFQLRFLGDYAKGKQFVVALGLRKKTKAHRPRDLDRAERILGEHVSRCKKGDSMMMANAFSECHGKAYERLVRQEELILDVTERLTVELLQAGVTKAELARRLGRTPGFVSQVFGGGRNLTLRTISDIAVALSVRPSFELTPDRGPATDTAWELISVKERRPKPWVAVAPPSPAGVQGPHGDEALPAAA